MILAHDVTTPLGMLVVSRGTRLQPTHLEKILNFANFIGIQGPLQILPGPPGSE